MKKTENHIEYIEWDDAYHLTDTWLSNEQIAERYKAGAFKVSNVGWVIFEDKRYIILSSKRDSTYHDHGFVMMIPKGMITERKILK